MPTTTPVFGWPIPTLSESADGPAAFNALGVAIENTLNDSSTVAYTPTWTSDGAIQPSNPASKVGWHKTRGKVCLFAANITFGPTTGGGNGPLRVGIPFAGKAGISPQMVLAQLNSPGIGLIMGQGEIRAGETNSLAVFPAQAASGNGANYWTSAAAGDTTPESGTPGTTGTNNVRNGGGIRISGTYLTA